MMKNQKTKVSLLLISAMFSILVFTGMKTFAQDTQEAVNKVPAATSQPAPSSKIFSDAPKTIPEKNAYELTHTRTGPKYIIFKFFATMFGVLVSALAIFLGLKIYKKFVLKSNENIDKIDYSKSLEGPKDFKEAINMFLDKTDK